MDWIRLVNDRTEESLKRVGNVFDNGEFRRFNNDDRCPTVCE